ncbi:MAG: hypothetical protein AUH15_04550 [Acidobacteriales bacterium 13_2_20CM_55_8]|nr:MAG: hypothetical protein AUH15_04550 [Acidobacteriales bacterium 13_2_20CM_55_8]
MVWLQACILLTLLLASAFSPAETLTGTVKNGTSDKPAAGDEVVLLKLGQGMEEAGRTKADAKGAFSFKVDDTSSPHLVRAIHQGVTYHRMAPPGTSSVDVVVYDVSKKIEALSVTADVLRFQARSNELQGIRLFAVDNKSKPPRTQMNDQNFEFYLPDGAEVDTAIAMTAGGQPLTTAPVPQKEKNRYAFIFPLRPGETQFQVVFHLPYRGEANIDPKELYGTQHFVVMLPKSMQFASTSGANFASMNDPRQPDAVVQVASNTKAGQPLAFKISGTGILTDQEGSNQEGGSPTAGSTTAGRDSRPGGGLGPPIDAPDPLEKYRWYILGGFALVMAAGAVYITKRPRTASLAGRSDIELPELPRAVTSSTAGRSGLLLEALKEELFELEVEHKQGHISQQEYEKARAALDQTLERALKRIVAKTT